MMNPSQWERVKQLFQEALDLPATDRASFLQRTCGADPDLQHEVESLLAAHARAGSFAEPPDAGGHRLRPGEHLGQYEITRFLAEGGMGQVYRARDTQLRRDVAIKILPAAFTTDPERLARFEREARLLAALNHPNIAAIYGIEEGPAEAGRHVRALVLELVEGKSLARRLKRGRLATSEALTIGCQIAEALEAAHARGIIHRDLKPANIHVRPDGVVKVLDFGLATVLAGDGRGTHALDLPTATVDRTAVGTVAGTPAYMSPEQISTAEVDKRTDIWAFGCVLYEMLAGRRAFPGHDVASTLATVLQSEADWAALPADVPAQVRALLRRCLHRDRAQRIGDVAAAVFVLTETTSLAAPEATTMQQPPGRRRALVAAAIAAIVVAGALFGISPFRGAPAVVAPPIRFEIPTPATSDPYSLAISPDGQHIVFAATSNGRTQLWLRSLDSPTSQRLPGTEGGGHPFWSPDSRTIGFISDSGLKRIDVLGGATQVLAPTGTGPFTTGGSWNRDGVLIFRSSLGAAGSVERLLPEGRGAVAVTRPDARHTVHSRPQFLPNNTHFLYVATQGTDRGVYVAALESRQERRVVEADAAVYAPPGYLLFARGQTLFAQRFDLDRVELVGVPVRLIPQVMIAEAVIAVSASETGVLTYRAAPAATSGELVWFDRTGRVLARMDAGPQLATVQLSPDGRQVAYSQALDGNTDVWLTDIARSVSTRFTFDAAAEAAPVWSPDATRLVFGSTRGNAGYNLYQKLASGAGTEELLFESPLSKFPQDWSRDGRFLLFRSVDPQTQRDLWALPLEGEPRPIAVAQTEFDERDGQFSPDGRWVAYASNASGRYEVYVQPFPDAGARWQVSTAGGHQPRWQSDGRELFYVRSDGALLAVLISVAPGGKAVELGKTTVLLTPRIAAVAPTQNHQYAVSPDGRRFLVLVAPEAISTTPITVVVNWTALLKR